MSGGRTAAGLAALVGLRLAVDAATFVANPSRYAQWEEAYNATVALWLWNGLPFGDALTLQYKAFCGGCTVVAALGAPLMGLAGDHQWAWKLVPLAWTAATIVVGFRALDLHAGRAAAWAFAILWAVPPTGLVDLALLGWGNHAETTLWVLAMGAAATRPLVGGLIAASAAWFCLTSLYGAVVWGGAALLRPGRGRFLIGAAVGAALFAIPAGAEDWGNYHFGAVLADSLPGAARRARALFWPSELATRAFPDSHHGTVLAAALLVAAATGAMAVAVDRAPRRAAFVALAMLFAAAFTFGPFSLMPMRMGAPPLNARYHAPWLAMLLVVTAAGLGPWLARPRRRVIALLGLGTALGASILANAQRLHAPDPSWRHRGAADPPRLIAFAADRLASAERLRSADPKVEAAFRTVEGAIRGREVLNGERALATAADGLGRDGLVGLGLGLPARQWRPEYLADTVDWLGTLPPETSAAVAEGIAANLSFQIGEGPGGVSVERAVQRLEHGGACALCAAAGRVAANGCRAWMVPPPPDLAACLSAVPGPADRRSLILQGAGLAWAAPSRDRRLDERLARELGTDAEAFLAGTRGPLAGMVTPLRFTRER